MSIPTMTLEQAMEEGWFVPNSSGGYCECGCGEKTPIAKQSSRKDKTLNGYPLRFVHGHHRRGIALAASTIEKKRKNLEGKVGPNHPAWKGGRVVDGDGYVRIWVGMDHPMANGMGYAMEHRLVMAERLGRMLDPEEVVHHRLECEGGTARATEARTSRSYEGGGWWEDE